MIAEKRSKTLKRGIIMEYRGMTISAETGLSGRTVYRVLRFRMDGKIVPLPWTYASIEAAQDYISAHGF